MIVSSDFLAFAKNPSWPETIWTIKQKASTIINGFHYPASSTREAISMHVVPISRDTLAEPERIHRCLFWDLIRWITRKEIRKLYNTLYIHLREVVDKLLQWLMFFFSSWKNAPQLGHLLMKIRPYGISRFAVEGHRLVQLRSRWSNIEGSFYSLRKNLSKNVNCTRTCCVMLMCWCVVLWPWRISRQWVILEEEFLSVIINSIVLGCPESF